MGIECSHKDTPDGRAMKFGVNLQAEILKGTIVESAIIERIVKTELIVCFQRHLMLIACQQSAVLHLDVVGIEAVVECDGKMTGENMGVLQIPTVTEANTIGLCHQLQCAKGEKKK